MAAESPTTTTASTGRSGDPARRQRADAQRNVLALLQAAKTVFADSGVDAPAKEITDLAGVGVGTLYRHFPRRSDLIVAVLEHDIDGCIDAARELTITLDPWDALAVWSERYTQFVGTKRGLAAALHSGDPAYDDQAAFSPDGKQLVFVSTRGGGTSTLWTMDIATRQVRRLTSGKGGDLNLSLVKISTEAGWSTAINLMWSR